jgi:exopolysaccharide biosynthesis polyprenyl glycosylphosphotransferase
MRSILKTHSSFFRTLFHILDLLIVVLLTYLLYMLGFVVPSELAKILAIYGSLLTAIIFPFFGLYRSRRGESLLLEARSVLTAWLVVLLGFNILILLLANSEQFKILWPYGLFKVGSFWVWAFACFLGMGAVRIGFRLFFLYIRKYGLNQRWAVIAGAGQVGINVAKYLHKNNWIGIQVSGFFDDRLGKDTAVQVTGNLSLPVLGNLKECINYCLEKRPDMLVITLPMRAEKKISNLVWNLATKGINVLLVPDLFIFGLQKARLVQWGEIPLMAFNLFPRWKRLFDIVFSLIVLTLGAPFFMLIALLIKLEDGGPVFYRHKRIGENGKPFGCIKFRTMHVDADKRLKELLDKDPKLRAEWEKTYKLKNDPRVTRVGRFLRKTSLDELPQFINVLKGEMSVVGARPIVNEELWKYYKDIAITYCAMKPGLTGPWQAGKRSDIEDYAERVELDEWYVLNVSFWLDMKIIIKTVLKMFTGKGAY